MKILNLILILIISQSCKDWRGKAFWITKDCFENSIEYENTGDIILFELNNSELKKEYCKDLCAPINPYTCYSCNPRRRLLIFFVPSDITIDKFDIDSLVLNPNVFTMGKNSLFDNDIYQKYWPYHEFIDLDEVLCQNEQSFISNGYLILKNYHVSGVLTVQDYKWFVRAEYHRKRIKKLPTPLGKNVLYVCVYK